MEQFDYSNISILVDRVKDIWSSSKEEDSFRRVYAEAIIRQDMHDNDMQFQFTENGQLKAIACASRKGDVIREKEWWSREYSKMTPRQQHSFSVSRDYLQMMDRKAYGFMSEKDVKLDLFISVEKGSGRRVLDQAFAVFRERGFKNLYLWTDCECNVDWYFSHGYELVDEDVFDPFSSNGEDYKTYVFKIKLS